MYYITNEKGWLIAADDALLEALGAASIESLQRDVIEGKIQLPAAERVTLADKTYKGEEAPLYSLLGEWRTVRFVLIETVSEDISVEEALKAAAMQEAAEPVQSEESSESLDILEALDLEEPVSASAETIEEEPLDLFGEEESAGTPFEEEESTIPIEEKGDELFDLLLPEEGKEQAPELKEETQSVSWNASRNAEEIGVGLDDYLAFVREYAQSARSLEADLKSADATKREDAVEKLARLANVLRLDDAQDLLEEIKHQPSDEKVARFLTVVETYARGEALIPTEEEQSSSAPIQEEALYDLEIPLDESFPTEEKYTETEGEYLYDDIDLSGIKPIHFDFTIEEAAKDLSLPAELIEEFIQDFIKQAHEETKQMIEAYRKGDLETVQKIGHLLKGTASNLRIGPLADTLYEIQFNDDIERVPELVQNYWAHFLSLENQMKLISH